MLVCTFANGSRRISCVPIVRTCTGACTPGAKAVVAPLPISVSDSYCCTLLENIEPAIGEKAWPGVA